MSEFEKANFITDRDLQDDPYPYFDWVREQGPVWREPHFGMYMITGHPEAMAVYSDPATNVSAPASAMAWMLSIFTPPSPSSRTSRPDSSMRRRTSAIFRSALGMNFCPPNPGFTDMMSTTSIFSSV